MTDVSSEPSEKPRRVPRRLRTPLWLLLLGGGIVVFFLRQGPVPQSIRLDLGASRSDLEGAALACTGPHGETAHSQWSKPFPDELWLNWMAAEGKAACEITLTGDFGSLSFERQVALDGAPIVLFSETVTKRAVQSE